MNKILNYLGIISWFFIFPVFVLITHVILLFLFNIYEVFPWFDMPMHFIGGISVAITYFLILQFFQKENYLKMNGFFNVLFIFALVSLTAVFWELFEFSAEFISGLNLQGNLGDTMIDFSLGMLGGLLAAIFLESQAKRYFKSKQSL